jgi:hypothetical protein
VLVTPSGICAMLLVAPCQNLCDGEISLIGSLTAELAKMTCRLKNLSEVENVDPVAICFVPNRAPGSRSAPRGVRGLVVVQIK